MISETVKRAAREIVEDMEEGRVPEEVASFAELHDYVDANEYGGACEDTADPSLDYWNKVQSVLDRWLKDEITIAGVDRWPNGWFCDGCARMHGDHVPTAQTPDGFVCPDYVAQTEADEAADEARRIPVLS